MADAVHEELDPEQSVQISGSHGIQVGDGNTQYNYTLAVPSLGVQEVSTWWTKNVAPIHGAAPDGGNRARRTAG